MSEISENEYDLRLVLCWFDEPHSPHDRFNADLRAYVHCPGLALPGDPATTPSSPGAPTPVEPVVASDEGVLHVYGACTACGSVEVALIKATGTQDFSSIGESPDYPAGYGCEVCA